MIRHFRSVLRFAVSLALMVLFLYWAFGGLDTESLWQAMTGASPIWVAAMVGTALLTLLLRAWRWTVFLRPCAPQVTLADAILALAICYTGNIAIPRSGEALRALSLKWSRHASMGSVLGTVVVERILDVVWLVLFIGVSLLLLHGRIQVEYPWMGSLTLMALAVSLALLVGLALISVYRRRALHVVERLLSPVSARLAARIAHLLETFIQGLEALHTPAAYAEILISSLLLNFGYCLIIYESLHCFGLDESHGLGVSAAVVVMAISSLGVVIPTPAGAGSYHYFFGQSLHVLLGVPLAAAMACATVVHAMANVTYLVIGGPALVIQWSRSRRREAKQNGEAEAELG